MTIAAPSTTIDLVRRVERALDVAAAAVELLDTGPALDLEALEAPPDKVVAETAMLLRAVGTVDAPALSQRVDELATALAPHARGTRVLAGIALHPALALDYAAAHLALSAAGRPDAVADEVLAGSLETPGVARERVPHRELEQRWLTRFAGKPQSTTVDVLDRTALGQGIDLLTGSRDDVYALTHAVLYATDFGGDRDVRLPRPTEAILDDAGSALAGALDDDDFDLAAELLCAWPALGGEWDAVSSFAFRVLSRVEDDVGVLPSLALDGDGYRAQAPEVRTHYVTSVTYHPAFVMGLLCAMCLRAGHEPAAEVVGSRYAASLVDVLLDELGTGAYDAQWRQDFEALRTEERERLGGFLGDVALRRAVRRLDFEAVRRTLRAEIDHGAPSTPLALQASRLLGRLARMPALGSTDER